MNTATLDRATEKPTERADQTLTKKIQTTLSNPATTSDFDLHGGVNEVLKDVGLTAADSGGKLTFYGQDPIIPSPHRFGTMAAIGLAAKAVAVAALWRQRTGDGQDITVDVRKALRRFCGFFEMKWETLNGRPPAPFEDPLNPFIGPNLFHETRDGRHIAAINIYPKLAAPRAWHPEVQSERRSRAKRYLAVARRGPRECGGRGRTSHGHGPYL